MTTLKLKMMAVVTLCIRSYWALPGKARRTCGWLLVCCSLTLFVLVGYGLYKTALWVGGWTVSLFEETGEDEESAPLFNVKEPNRSYHLTKHLKTRFNYSRDFNDINDTQLRAARRLGIRPIADREAAERMTDQLIYIRDCQYYSVDALTHSIPYLIPDAADFLSELGKLFQEYSGSKSRFIITSVLRTQNDVKRLRRSGNMNASENSCHFYATTFDITYNRFDNAGSKRAGRLKEDLAAALYDLRAAGYCYVKYEYKQACFHVTVRP